METALLRSSDVGTGSLGKPLAVDLGPLVTVRFYMAHSVVTGLLRLRFHRLSDQLNYGSPVLELVQAEISRRDTDYQYRASGGGLINRAAVLMAVDQVSDEYAATTSALRQDKVAVDVMADLGHFTVAGTLQVRQGTDVATWLRDAPHFVPLTGVTILGVGSQPVTERRAIINRVMLSALLF